MQLSNIDIYDINTVHTVFAIMKFYSFLIIKLIFIACIKLKAPSDQCRLPFINNEKVEKCDKIVWYIYRGSFLLVVFT